MKAKDLHKDLNKTDDGTEQGHHKSTPTVFYRIPCCSQCGEDNLTLLDFGVHLRSGFLGITGGGNMGCDRIKLEGGHKYLVACFSCGYQRFHGPTITTAEFMEWAEGEGRELRTLNFTCPVCGSTRLREHRTGVELFQEIVAVYSIPQDNEANERAEIALLPTREISGATAPRYRCENDHELAKDDGTPVETAEELVAWLNARSTGDPVDR